MDRLVDDDTWLEMLSSIPVQRMWSWNVRVEFVAISCHMWAHSRPSRTLLFFWQISDHL